MPAELGPFVVLEGPDGGGKSTLAKALTARGFSYDHCGPPEKPAFDFWVDKVKATSGPTVFDRLHLGSYVYGRAFRGKDDMSDLERWLFDGMLWRNDALMVIARPPDAVLDANLMRGPDNDDAKIYEDPARRALVRSLYDDIIDERGERIVDLPIITYDFTSEACGLSSVMSCVDEWLASRLRAGPPLLPARIPAQGNVRNPRYVFVGEQPHCRARILQRAKARGLDISRYVEIARMFERQSPPVVFNSPSGRYLQTALSGLSLSDYCIFNALQLDGSHVEEFVDPAVVEAWRGEVEWVALGNMASAELTHARIEHRVVPHPQYVKRFHYKRGLTQYGPALRGDTAWD